MANPSKRDLAGAVLEHYGRTYAEEARIRLKDTPAPLFQLLNAALLLSARIPAGNAVQGIDRCRADHTAQDGRVELAGTGRCEHLARLQTL